MDRHRYTDGIDGGGGDGLVLDLIYSSRAIDKELSVLAGLSTTDQRGSGKPGSKFSVCILKICSLIKGNRSVSEDVVKRRVAAIVDGFGGRVRRKAFETTWSRGMARAVPRGRRR